MKRRTAPGLTGTQPLMALTGQHAPVSGWWRPDGNPTPYKQIQQGELMPSLNGEPVQWALELAIPPSHRSGLSRVTA